MNNCAVRTVLSGVLGAGLGVAFGIFMGTMDTAVRLALAKCPRIPLNAVVQDQAWPEYVTFPVKFEV